MHGPSADLLLILPVLLASLVLHELAHGLVADALGDPTARAMGRLTLNPLPHLDLFGTLMLVFTALSGSFLFGWAKPVPVDPRHFSSPQRGMMLVGAAGPLTNLAIAVVAAQLFRFVQDTGQLLFQLALYLFVLNVFLFLLNLIPIPPLDGSRVVGGLLPARLYAGWVSLDRFANVLFLAVFVVIIARQGVFTSVFEPPLKAVSAVLLPHWVYVYLWG